MSNQFKTMRLKLKASQEDFAQVMNCSQQFISYIETGDRNPTHEQLTELCRHYVCTFEDLGYTVRSRMIVVPITEDHAITTRAAKQA
jgi:DNA-binding XRE family transcriptional regulator